MPTKRPGTALARALRPAMLLGFAALGWAGSLGAEPASDRLVLLEETGERHDELPVFRRLADGGEIERLLHLGLSGRLLRIYQLEQEYLHRAEGAEREPVYVLLSERQGGFARQGFFLGEIDKRHAAYVDLHREWPVVGEFAAIDQLLPHELFHAMRRQLVGPLGDGYANQVHALGVRTDRFTAFNEGFAESFQVVAIDDPEAHPSTRALASATAAAAAVEARLAAYGDELTARLAIVPRLRMGFLAWFSNGEDVLRYFAVKANALARERPVPERLLGSRDPYRAYLFENTLPGRPQDPPKPLSRLLATEGVVSALMERWAASEPLRQSYREPEFYGLFGTRADQVGPLENVYLKILHVLYLHRVEDVVALVNGYSSTFPDEAEAVADLVEEVFFVRSLDPAKEIWLANTDFETGTTLFDQYRGLGREHTFDLNGASPVDLVSVPGIDLDLARAILAASPFDSIDDLSAVPGMRRENVETFHRMKAAMDRLIAEASEENVEDTIRIETILTPYAWRAGWTLVASALVGAVLYRAARNRAFAGRPVVERPRGWRAILAGLVASLVALLAGWAAPQGAGLASLAAVAAFPGLPAVLWASWRSRSPRAGLATLAAWLAAALPAAIAVTPLF